MIGDNEVNDIAPAKALGCLAIPVAIDRPSTASVANATTTSLWEAARIWRQLAAV